MAGVAAAYHLAARHGVRRVVLVDERPPLSLTSDKSTEAYRNFWPGPDDAMVRFMNRSIDLLEELAEASGERVPDEPAGLRVRHGGSGPRHGAPGDGRARRRLGRRPSSDPRRRPGRRGLPAALRGRLARAARRDRPPPGPGPDPPALPVRRRRHRGAPARAPVRLAVRPAARDASPRAGPPRRRRARRGPPGRGGRRGRPGHGSADRRPGRPPDARHGAPGPRRGPAPARGRAAPRRHAPRVLGAAPQDRHRGHARRGAARRPVPDLGRCADARLEPRGARGARGRARASLDARAVPRGRPHSPGGREPREPDSARPLVVRLRGRPTSSSRCRSRPTTPSSSSAGWRAWCPASPAISTRCRAPTSTAATTRRRARTAR